MAFHTHRHAANVRRQGNTTMDADFSPYSAPGIIALDACTARSGIVNCIVVEDDEQQ